MWIYLVQHRDWWRVIVNTLTLGHITCQDRFARFSFLTDVFMKIHALRDMTPFCLVVNDVLENFFALIFKLQKFG